MPDLEIALRALLIAVLATAGVGKLRSAATFRAVAADLPTSALPLLGRLPARPVTALLTATELGTAALLVVWTSGAGFVAASVLFAAMSAALGYLTTRKQRFRCRCYGADSGELTPSHAVRAIILSCLSVAGLALAAAGGHPPVVAATTAGSAIGGVMAAILIINWDLLGYLLPDTGRPA